MPATKGRLVCVDCIAEGLPLTRKATRPGPRCATHKRLAKQRGSDARWAAHILDTYTLTVEEYWALYEAQGGRCACCQRASGKTRRLSVDHDHKCCSGRKSCGRCVRGLLCRPCNTLLGRARDAIEFFARCIEYLTNPPAQRILSQTRRKRR
jgi:hypothetical protein